MLQIYTLSEIYCFHPDKPYTFLSPSSTGGMQHQYYVHTFTILGKTAVTIVLVEVMF